MSKLSIKMACLGDISLNNVKNNKIVLNGISRYSDLFLNYDLIIANLESPIYIERRENIYKSPRVISKKDNFELIKSFGLKYVSLANNHIYDALEEGFKATINKLESFGIKYGGAGFTAEDSINPTYIEINNIKLCLVSYVDHSTNPFIPYNAGIKLNYLNEKIIDDISVYKKNCDHLIVQIHWGRDFIPLPDYHQRLTARNIILAGADLIIGNHPHIICRYEIINSKYVFYSLGNFYFPDILFNGKLLIWPNYSNKSIIPCFEITKTDIKLKETHLSIFNKYNISLSIINNEKYLLKSPFKKNGFNYYLTVLYYSYLLELFYKIKKRLVLIRK